jgi:hypothetical protein
VAGPPLNFVPYPCLGAPIDGFCPQTPTYPARECVSGAAWWGSRFTGKPWPKGWGNADNWPAAARAAGFTVNGTPAANTIMCVPPNTNGSGKKGHVAWVNGEPASGAVAVWEVNWKPEYGFDYRMAPTANCEYIHLAGSVIHPPAPPPTFTEALPMFIVIGPGNVGIYFLYADGTLIPVGKPVTVTSATAAGVKTIHLAIDDTETWAAMLAKSTRVNP